MVLTSARVDHGRNEFVFSFGEDRREWPIVVGLAEWFCVGPTDTWLLEESDAGQSASFEQIDAPLRYASEFAALSNINKAQ